MSVGFAAAQALEKGRDRQDQAAVCQADIACYHDSIAGGLTFKGLLVRDVPKPLAIAALRVHRCPKIRMTVGSKITRSLVRSRG